MTDKRWEDCVWVSRVEGTYHPAVFGMLHISVWGTSQESLRWVVIWEIGFWNSKSLSTRHSESDFVPWGGKLREKGGGGKRRVIKSNMLLWFLETGYTKERTIWDLKPHDSMIIEYFHQRPRFSFSLIFLTLGRQMERLQTHQILLPCRHTFQHQVKNEIHIMGYFS